MAYKHLFFDLDHTLWDFEQNSRNTWLELFDQYNLDGVLKADFESFLAAYNIHNERLWEKFRNGKLKRAELRWKRIWLTMIDFKVENLPLAEMLSTAYLDILPKQIILMPGAKEVLDYCKEKYTLHLITNGFEATQWQKLNSCGIGSYFKEVITSEMSMSMKPHRDIFDYALKTANTSAAECLMIGDALEIDVLGAMNAGWHSVYYNPAKIPHNAKPTYEIAHFEELKGFL